MRRSTSLPFTLGRSQSSRIRSGKGAPSFLFVKQQPEGLLAVCGDRKLPADDSLAIVESPFNQVQVRKTVLDHEQANSASGVHEVLPNSRGAKTSTGLTVFRFPSTLPMPKA